MNPVIATRFITIPCITDNLRPDITARRTKKNNIVKFIEYDEESILPTVRKIIKVTVPTDDFEIGQYWADVGIEECGGATDLLTFDIMEPGSLRADGKINKISNKFFKSIAIK